MGGPCSEHEPRCREEELNVTKCQELGEGETICVCVGNLDREGLGCGKFVQYYIVV